MKELRVIMVSGLTCLLMASCSVTNNKLATYDLTKENITITDSKSVIGTLAVKNEKGAWVDVLPKALSYQISLEQDGSKKDYINDKDVLTATIQPSKELKQASIDVLGSDIFSSENNRYGRTVSIRGFDDTKNGTIILNYYVGSETVTKEMPQAPPDEKLKILRDVAKHSTLEIKRKEEVIGLYNLETGKKIKMK